MKVFVCPPVLSLHGYVFAVDHYNMISWITWNHSGTNCSHNNQQANMK